MKTKVNTDGIKILDAGRIATGGRVAAAWEDREIELIKFTKANTFNKKVQTDSAEFIKYFGIRGIEFGNWMTQEDRLQFIYGAAHAFEELRKFLNIPAKYIGLSGELAIAFGARGKTGAMAHYETWNKVINITKPHATGGSLFHEYTHAVDHIVYEKIRNKHESGLANLGFISGGHTTAKGIDLRRLERADLIGAMENIFVNLYYNKDKSKRKWLTDFEATKYGKLDYWNRRNEMLARSCEVWCHQLADKLGTKNEMLVKDKYDAIVYPPNNVISPIFDDIKLFFQKSINFINGKGSYKVTKSWGVPEPTKVKLTKKSKTKPAPKPKASKGDKKSYELGRKVWESGKTDLSYSDVEKIAEKEAKDIIFNFDQFEKGYLAAKKDDEKKKKPKAKKKDSKFTQVALVEKLKDKNTGKVAEIHKYQKNGTKRVFYAPSVDGKRMNTTMFARLGEAKKLARGYFKYLNEKKPSKKKVEAKELKGISNNQGNATEIDTQTETLKAKYAIVELTDLIQSNDPHTFKANPRYPAECQTRNYNEIKGEQEKVIKYSSNFKPNHLVNDSPDATTGSPVVTGKGVVLGGNGRTMVLKRLPKAGYDKYVSYLTKKLSDFGLSKRDLEGINKPVLVRYMPMVSMSKCSYYSDTLNSNTMQAFDPTTKAISIAKSIDDKTFARIANLFEDTEGTTFAQVLAVPNVQKKIIDILTDKKFINTSNRDVWLDNGRLSNTGKDVLENVLLAYILPDKKLIEKAKVYTNKITKALPLLVKIKQFKGSWNLIPDIQDVIKFENSRRATGQTRTDYLNQNDVFSGSDKPKVSDKQKLVWSLLDAGVYTFKDALASYVRTHDNENSGSAMFGGEKVSPTEVLANLRKVKGLSDKYRAVTPIAEIANPNPAKPKKKRTKATTDVEKLSDKPKKRKTTKKSKKTASKPKKKVRLTFLDRMFGVEK